MCVSPKTSLNHVSSHQELSCSHQSFRWKPSSMSQQTCRPFLQPCERDILNKKKKLVWCLSGWTLSHWFGRRGQALFKRDSPLFLLAAAVEANQSQLRHTIASSKPASNRTLIWQKGWEQWFYNLFFFVEKIYFQKAVTFNKRLLITFSNATF